MSNEDYGFLRPKKQQVKTDVLFDEKPKKTQAEHEKIRLANEDALKKPVTKLGKKGDTFYAFEERYLILERSDQYLLLQINKLTLNPDGSPPLIPNSRRETEGQIYWDLRAVLVDQEPEVNGFGEPTGHLTERKEYIRPSYTLEIDEVDKKGMPTGKPGTNCDKEYQHQRYLEAVKNYESSTDQKQAAKDEQKKVSRLENERLVMIGSLKELKLTARNELKEAMRGVKVGSKLLENSELAEIVNELNFYETILKNM